MSQTEMVFCDTNVASTSKKTPVCPEFEKQYKDTKHLRGQVISVWSEINERITLSCMYLGDVICAVNRDYLLVQAHPCVVRSLWNNPAKVGKEMAANPAHFRELARAQEMCRIDVIRLRIQDMVNASCNCRSVVYEMDAFLDAGRPIPHDQYMERYTEWIDKSIYPVYVWCCNNANNVMDEAAHVRRAEKDYLEILKENPGMLDKLYVEYRHDVRTVNDAALHGERDISQLDIAEIREKRIVNGVSFTTDISRSRLYAYLQKDPFIEFKRRNDLLFEFDHRLRHSYAFFTNVMDAFCQAMYESCAARLKKETVQVGFSLNESSIASRNTAALGRVTRTVVMNPELYDPFLVKKRARKSEKVELRLVEAPVVELTRDRFDVEVQDESMCVPKNAEKSSTPVEIWPEALCVEDELSQPLFDMEPPLSCLDDPSEWFTPENSTTIGF